MLLSLSGYCSFVRSWRTNIGRCRLFHCHGLAIMLFNGQVLRYCNSEILLDSLSWTCSDAVHLSVSDVRQVWNVTCSITMNLQSCCLFVRSWGKVRLWVRLIHYHELIMMLFICRVLWYGKSEMLLKPLAWTCNDADPLSGREVETQSGVAWSIIMNLQFICQGLKYEQK